MICQLEKMCKEAVVAYFKDTVPAFALRDWIKPKYASVRVTGLRTEIGDRKLRNKKPICYPVGATCVKLLYYALKMAFRVEHIFNTSVIL